MTIIHVAQDAIRKNTKHGTNDPAIIIRENSRKSARHHEVELRDETGRVLGVFRYRPHDPLSCGARVWLELSEGISATPIAEPQEDKISCCAECGSGDYGLCTISNRVYCRECGFWMPVNWTGSLDQSIADWNARWEKANA